MVIDALVGGLHGEDVVVYPGGLSVRFRDREGEVGVFVNDLLRFGGLSIIYGPLGAGKSTFMSLLGRVNSRVNALSDAVFVYLNQAQDLKGFVGVYTGFGQHVGIRDRIVGLISSVGVGPVSINLAELLNVLVSAFRDFRSDIKGKALVVIHDDLDKYVLTNMGGFTQLNNLIRAYAESFEVKAIWESLWEPLGVRQVNVIFGLSDQRAVRIYGELHGKGGLALYLMWNLPKEPFMDVVRELASRTGRRLDTDGEELIWQLVGGNVRTLGELVIGYNWDVEAWIQEKLNEPSTRKVLNALMSIGHAEPDVVYEETVERAYREHRFQEAREWEELLESTNTLINIGMAKRLSQLPNEPWVGRHHAYQSPIHYWAVKTTIETGSLAFTARELINTITRKQ